MSKKTSLRQMFSKPALHVSTPDDFWPLPSQFIGVEIELEGQSSRERRTHSDNGMPFWAEHSDASLRNGVEYVLSQPMMGSTLKEAIHYWFRTFKTYDDNPRTSIHVHINMLQDEESLEGLRNMLVLYYMFEDAFFAIADEGRKWNGYCNPFEDDPPQVLQAFMREDNPREMANYWERPGRNSELGPRYYGLNLLALGRFGTLEFRHMPLVRDEDRVFDWIKLIMELKAAANRMADDGQTPADVFLTPDHLLKLSDYMPRFGDILLRHTDAQTAFVRMSNINTLRLPTGDPYLDLIENKAWQRYVEVQKKDGRKQGSAPKKGGKSKASMFDAALGRPRPAPGATISANRLGGSEFRWAEPMSVFSESDSETFRSIAEGILNDAPVAPSPAPRVNPEDRLPDVAVDGFARPRGTTTLVWSQYLSMAQRAQEQARVERERRNVQAQVDEARVLTNSLRNSTSNT